MARGEERGFHVEQVKDFPAWKITSHSVGTLPKSLRGIFTSEAGAEQAIRIFQNHVRNKVRQNGSPIKRTGS